MTLTPALASVGAVVLAGCLVAGPALGAESAASAASTPASTPARPSTGARTVAARDFTPGRHTVSFTVDGVKRTAVLVVPQKPARPAPLVFVFHGHGGSGANVDRRFDIERWWPAAIVVYPDGLVGHQGITDPAGLKSGWQTRLGESGDRDIAFYDTMLATIRHRLAVQRGRIYLMGHSNGSAFASLLLNQRGTAVAAIATLSAQPGARLLATDPARSMFMSMGVTDPIVPYANQRKSIPLAEAKLGVDPATAKVTGYLRTETGHRNLELATYIYPGGHEPPPEVAPLVVAFFRRHTLAAG